MNKTALGTIVGTALLGLAKKHSGSSVKIKKFNVFTIEHSYVFGIDYDFFWDLVDDPELKSALFNGFYQKCSSVNSVNVYLHLQPDEEDLDEEDYLEENRPYIQGFIKLVVEVTFRSESYIQSLNERNHSYHQPAAESIFNTEKNKFIEYMYKEWQLNPNFEGTHRRIHSGHTDIFFQRNGDWALYRPPNMASKLRTR